jgi:hypothetical protein
MIRRPRIDAPGNSIPLFCGDLTEHPAANRSRRAKHHAAHRPLINDALA